MFVIVQAWNNLPLDFVKNRGVPEAIGIALQHAVSSIPGRFSNKYVLANQGLQILLMSGVGVTSALQILESFCNIWSQVSQRKKPFSDFPARGPGMYTLS